MSELQVGKINGEKQQDADEINVIAWRIVQISSDAGYRGAKRVVCRRWRSLESWQNTAEERVPSLRNTNEVIGAYVTAGARIHLYGFLDTLQEKAIYTDTDSDIYTAMA